MKHDDGFRIGAKGQVQAKCLTQPIDRGSTTSDDWSPSRRKLECSAGKVMVGLNTLWVYAVEPNARGKPHKILCCDR
jgi:hypothetical protein